MALAIDVIDRHGPSNERHRQLKLYYLLYNSKKRFTQPLSLITGSTLVLKVDTYVLQMENGKIYCQSQPKKNKVWLY